MKSSPHGALGEQPYSQTSNPSRSVFKMVADLAEILLSGPGTLEVFYRFSIDLLLNWLHITLIHIGQTEKMVRPVPGLCIWWAINNYSSFHALAFTFVAYQGTWDLCILSQVSRGFFPLRELSVPKTPSFYTTLGAAILNSWGNWLLWKSVRPIPVLRWG